MSAQVTDGADLVIRARAWVDTLLTNKTHTNMNSAGYITDLSDALQTVLDMHAPQHDETSHTGRSCYACIDSCSYDSWPAPYPCETVTAIMKVLEREP